MLGTPPRLSGSKSSMRLSRRAALSALILPVLTAGTLSIYALQLRREADGLIAIAYSLSRHGPPPTVEMLRQRFGSALRQSAPCSEGGCGYELVVSNRVLAALHLAPPTTLLVEFWARKGIVDVNGLQYWTVNRQGRMILSYVTVKYDDSFDWFMVGPHENNASLESTGSLEISYRSTEHLKQMALAFDAGCLTRWRGCTNIAELSPDVWQQTSARTLRCQIPNCDGMSCDMSGQH